MSVRVPGAWPQGFHGFRRPFVTALDYQEVPTLTLSTYRATLLSGGVALLLSKQWTHMKSLSIPYN